VFLTPDELVELTHRHKGAWQARELDKLGIRYRRRSDGSLVVLRDDLRTEQDRVTQPRLRAG
jgi:hypothetical protein